MRTFTREATALENAIRKLAAEHIRIQDECFPPPLRRSEYDTLFKLHANEAAGEPFELDFKRYFQLEIDGRLIFIAARDDASNSYMSPVIGYSCHFWYRDLHFNRRVCCDDLWFVLPQYRKRGIGTALKLYGHDMMRYRGCTRVSDTIRNQFEHPNLMAALKFSPRATQWTKDL